MKKLLIGLMMLGLSVNFTAKSMLPLSEEELSGSESEKDEKNKISQTQAGGALSIQVKKFRVRSKFETVPHHLLSLIHSFTGDATTRKNFKLTCHKAFEAYRYVSNTMIGRRFFTRYLFFNSLKGISELRYPLLETLSFLRSDYTSTQINQMLKNYPDLKELKLMDCFWHATTTDEDLCMIVDTCKSLENLEVSNSFQLQNPIIKAKTQLTKLKRLGLRHLSANIGKHFELIINTCPVLEDLDLSYAMNLQNLMIKSTVLKRLTLKCSPVDNASIAQIMQKCPALEQLDIEGCDAITTLNISSSILTQLNIAGCRGLRNFSVQGCSKLKSIILSNNNIVSFGPGVKELDFSKSSDVVDAVLEELIRLCPDLEKLNLQGCWCLRNPNIYSKHLKKVDIRGTSINREALDYMHRNCPELQFAHVIQDNPVVAVSQPQLSKWDRLKSACRKVLNGVVDNRLTNNLATRAVGSTVQFITNKVERIKMFFRRMHPNTKLLLMMMMTFTISRLGDKAFADHGIKVHVPSDIDICEIGGSEHVRAIHEMMSDRLLPLFKPMVEKILEQESYGNSEILQALLAMMT